MLYGTATPLAITWPDASIGIGPFRAGCWRSGERTARPFRPSRLTLASTGGFFMRRGTDTGLKKR